MSAPSSTMLVTNTGNSVIYADGQEIDVSSNFTFDADQIAGVCADINFWAAFLAGNCSVALNGQALPPTTPAVVAFLIAVAIGDIVPS
jgi:hypothetical protein